MVDQKEYDQFIKAIEGAVKKFGEKKVADTLNVSVPSVRRWLQGGNLPHIALIPSAMVALRILNEAG